MRTGWMTTAFAISGLAVGAALVAVGDEPAPVSFEYEVVELDGKLLQEAPGPERRLNTGDRARSGAELRTGWSSSAELLVDAENCRFRLGARTRVKLAADRPGVLLELERGRVRAGFGPLAGAPHERVVATPSAVLAVRGTQYAIAVDRKGNTTLTVFEGEVEVADVGHVGPVRRVGSGTACRIDKGEAAGMPFPHRMSPGDWDRGRSVDSPREPSHGMDAGRPMPGGGGSPHHRGGGGK